MGAPLRPALVFIGFMAAGKSTAALEAAAALGEAALDTDELLERQFGETIPSFFEREGEPAFRAAEERLVDEVLERADGGVVALGGGALGSARTREALRRHTVVLVDVDLETAWARACGEGRPLARDHAAFARLFAERAATYEAAADAVIPGTGDPRLAGRAAPALTAIPDGLTLLWATSASSDYPVWIGADALWRAPWPAAGRRVVVTDDNVKAAQPALVDPEGHDARTVLTIAPGEEHKTLWMAERLWKGMVEAGTTRADHVVAVGGGVVGDLAGFCAATYQRGIPVVHVPTTIVAQVDSAYGGKTGVDLPEAKNYVGAYHQPAGVLVDPGVLGTLPPQERAAGYAEVVKTALIAGGPLWERVAAGAGVDDAIVRACARTKLRVVAADERDTGVRQVLNLGHTVGHAIETTTGYAQYRHGEAVGLGLLAALRLSGQDALRDQVADLLRAAGLPTRADGVDPDAIVAATARDKKRIGAQVPFVLVHAPGDVRHGEPVAPATLAAAVRELTA